TPFIREERISYVREASLIRGDSVNPFNLLY
ncbi:unnamed protein product, partial [marine sediment metagenome]